MKYIVLAVVLLTTSAHAEERFYDSHGHLVGSAKLVGKDLRFYDSHGHYRGYMTKQGDELRRYDAQGHYLGYTRKTE